MKEIYRINQLIFRLIQKAPTSQQKKPGGGEKKKIMNQMVIHFSN